MPVRRPSACAATCAARPLVRERIAPGLKVNGTPSPNQDMAALAPGGGICLSAEDPARLARVEINGVGPAVVLTSESVFTVGEGEQVALGGHISDWVQGWRALDHNAAIGGYTASVSAGTASQRAGIVLSSLMHEGRHGEAVRELGRPLLVRIEPRRAGRPRSRSPLSPHRSNADRAELSLVGAALE